MPSLQTVALGLVIVFLDVSGNGYDLVADPAGWLLVLLGLAPLRDRLPGQAGVVAATWVCLATSVLVWPPDSVAHAEESLEWLFSLPTLAFGVLLAGGLAQVTGRRLAARFRLLRTVFVVAAVLPVLIYGSGWDWLVLPAAVLLVLANVMLVVWVWSASSVRGTRPDVAADTDEVPGL